MDGMRYKAVSTERWGIRRWVVFDKKTGKIVEIDLEPHRAAEICDRLNDEFERSRAAAASP
ncbi:MAG: hypothetical protein U1E53_35050 [Dongiaceae bacterium]